MEPLIRPYRPEDVDAFRTIHAASGMDYQFPQLDSPLFIVKRVAERAGWPTTLVAARIEAEVYLISSGAPREKLDDIESLQPAFLAALWEQGIDSAYCMVPDEVNRHFAKRMERLGWLRGRPGWTPWTRSTI